ncbi:unnamed protein product [Dovyalis caffra]|uniref:Uncharacterized protein n=1 Tax=Dovyalis caffra TaxID=77055 RepID=A0AAV1RTN3_9ROSI|nr:unnamed protein product [Dovyalis caffra]
MELCHRIHPAKVLKKFSLVIAQQTKHLINVSWLHLLPSFEDTDFLAEPGFDPGTCGLWAHHASAAPLRFLHQLVKIIYRQEEDAKSAKRSLLQLPTWPEGNAEVVFSQRMANRALPCFIRARNKDALDSTASE